jgi:hypothetical protein
MAQSRKVGLIGLPTGAVVGAVFGWSPWVSGVVGFIVFAELPDLVYRRRARRGDAGPLLPAWDASEAYIVTLRRSRRSASPAGHGDAAAGSQATPADRSQATPADRSQATPTDKENS